MKTGAFRFNGFMAVLATAVAASVLGFILVLLFGLAGSTGKPHRRDRICHAIIAIVLDLGAGLRV